MSRRSRMHVPGGFYYIISQRNPEQPAFFGKVPDYALFESVLAETLLKYKAKAYAYCWMPRAIHLIVKNGTASTSHLMQRLLSQYARQKRGRSAETQELCPQQRYHAVLFDAKEYLFRLVHYVHWLPALGAEIGSPEGYDRCSLRHYAAKARIPIPWLSIQEVLDELAVHPRNARLAYQKRMKKRPEPQDIECFEHAATCHAEVLGNRMFRCTLPRQFPVHRSLITLDQIIDSTSLHFEVDPNDIRSGVRAKGFSLVRAVIAWHVTERRIAKLDDVAARVRRSAPTLVQAIQRHKARTPEFFSLAAFPDLVPFAPLVPIGALPSRTTPDESLADDSNVPRRPEAPSVKRVAV